MDHVKSLLSRGTIVIIISVLTSAESNPSSETLLIRQPKENYYVTRHKSATIVCEAKNATAIIFVCNGTRIPQTSVEDVDSPDLPPEVLQAKIVVTRADVQNHGDGATFWCTCGAVGGDGQVADTSEKGHIWIAYLKHKFEAQPKSMTAKSGENVELECVPPKGNPKPKITWKRDNKRIQAGFRFIVTDLGSLVIRDAVEEDSGVYQCLAANDAGRRESEIAHINVTALEEFAESAVATTDTGEGRNKTGAGKPRTTRQSIKTYFTTEPEEKYHVAPSKHLQMDCSIIAGDILTFKCNGERMGREKHTIKQGLDSAGNRKIESQLNITYDEVQTFQKDFGNSITFQCSCVAWFQDSNSPNGWGRLESSASHGFVYLAYLENTFQAEPSDVAVRANTQVTLTCEPPRGEPSPWVHWMKDNQQLDPRSSDKHSINSKGHLIIHDVTAEDAGVYNCLAENSAGSVQSKPARLTVVAGAKEATAATHSQEGDDYIPTFPDVIPKRPVFIRNFETENVLGKDGTKTMICAVVSATQMTVECGGRRLAADLYELKSERQGDAVIWYAKTVINQTQMSQNPDNYFCQCIAWLLNEQKKWEKEISNRGFIRMPAQGPYIEDEFVISPTDTSAYYEGDAQLQCAPPEGSPPPTVYWLKDGTRIDPAEDPNFVVLDLGTLVIEYVRETDEGSYNCVAENGAGRRVSTAIRFTVLGKPATLEPAVTLPPPHGPTTTTTTQPKPDYTWYNEPRFVENPSRENFVVGDEPVTLKCTSYHTKRLVFVCNGTVMRDAEHSVKTQYFPRTIEFHDLSLVVTKENVEAHGEAEEFSCLCRAYRKGDVEKFVDSSTAIVKIAYLNTDFQLEPSHTVVLLSGKAELVCRAPAGLPEPQVYWQKDGTRVVQSERVYVKDGANLIIERFSHEDVGSYSCVAENLAGSRASQIISVTLPHGEVPPVTEPDIGQPEPDTTQAGQKERVLYPGEPYISKDLHSFYYLVKNKQTTLICEAHGVDFITFTCGPNDVENQETRERMDEQVLADGQVQLVKVVEASVDVDKEEVESYQGEKPYWCQCYAHYRDPASEGYHILTSSRAVIESAYLKKTFQKEPESRTVTEGQSLTILCVPPQGNPEPKVSWTKDGEMFEMPNVGLSGALIFLEARLEHTGEYVCVAENEAGKRTSTPILIEVKEKEYTDEEGSDYSECAEILTNCQTSLPHTTNPQQFCAAVPEYSVCMDSYIAKCTGVITEDSMNAVRTAYSHTKDSCEQKSQCKELVQCERLASIIPTSGLSVNSLCLEETTLSNCVNHAVMECSSGLSQEDEKVVKNLMQISQWFSNYCQHVIRDGRAVESCDKMSICDVNIKHHSGTNTTFCTLIDTLVDCTSDALTICNLNDLRNNLESLFSEDLPTSCSEDDDYGDGTVTLPGYQPDGTPEIDLETATEGTDYDGDDVDAVVDPDGDDGDTVVEPDGNDVDVVDEPNAAAGSSGQEKPETKASKENNGSTTLCSSVFLAIVFQILTAVTFSLR